MSKQSRHSDPLGAIHHAHFRPSERKGQVGGQPPLTTNRELGWILLIGMAKRVRLIRGRMHLYAHPRPYTLSLVALPRFRTYCTSRMLGPRRSHARLRP